MEKKREVKESLYGQLISVSPACTKTRKLIYHDCSEVLTIMGHTITRLMRHRNWALAVIMSRTWSEFCAHKQVLMHTALQPFWFSLVVLSTTPQPFWFDLCSYTTSGCPTVGCKRNLHRPDLLDHLGVPDGWSRFPFPFIRIAYTSPRGARRLAIRQLPGPLRVDRHAIPLRIY